MQENGEGTPVLDRQGASGNGAPGLLTREALMLALWRQRAYADRTGTPFVFVRVGLKPTHRAAWSQRLGRLASGLCRAGDAAGWCDRRKDRVGMLLPGATAQGGLRVVRDLEAALCARANGAERVPEVACEVFVYPSAAYAPAVDWAVGGLDAERV